MIKHRYYVVYTFVTKSGGRSEGCCTMDTKHKITSWEQIDTMNKQLVEENGWSTAIITNYIYLAQVAAE